MNADIYISDHARQRIKERCGIKSKKKADHLCSIAYTRGIQAAQTKGALKDWIERKTRPGSYIACYNQMALVFSYKSTAECITVLQIPECIRKDMKKLVLPA